MTLVDHFLKFFKTTPHNDEFKTLTVASEANVPILFNVILPLHPTLHGGTQTLVIPFAVANVKYSFLGTPFFEQYAKRTLDNEHMSLTYKTPHEPLLFTAHEEKDYP